MKQRAKLEAEIIALQKENERLTQEADIFEVSQDLIPRARNLFHQGSAIFSVPSVPHNYQIDPYHLIHLLNESIEEKVKSINIQNIYYVCSYQIV